MLVEFALGNYRSIKEEMRLSLVASPDKRLEDSNVVTNELGPGVRPIRLLRSAAIYGANASGKTNLLRGLSAMHDIVVNSSGNLDQLPVTPFRFDPACHNKPSQFEVVCIADNVRYQYGFSATRHEVVDEWLYAWPRRQMQVWFERSRGVAPGTSRWTLGGKLTGDRQVWQRATRPQALFLSTAVALNSTQLLPLFNWFRERLRVVVGYREVNPEYTTKYCDERDRSEVVDFLAASDLAISDIRIVQKRTALDEEVGSKQSDATPVDVLVQHQPEGGEPAEIDISEESDGTRKMFALAGPWVDSLARGNVIVLDELHDNLHPELVRFLVAQFHDPAASPYGAQLIYSTHDTSILTQDLLRRDQIWFCRRDERLETSIFPVSDFRMRRSDEDLERAYRAGRFGALPYVRRSRRPLFAATPTTRCTACSIGTNMPTS